ncbi:MAG: GntR family transcriptional regulator [Anaerolineales bacterium]
MHILASRKPLKEEIFETLHERIISGQYQPGTWLRQEEVASQLDVSMTPVREALDLLVAVGLAERVPYRGVRVPKPSAEEMAEAYAIRLLLEQIGARAAAIKREQAQVEEMKRIISQAENLLTLSEMSTSRKLSRQFHKTIIHASGNSVLERIYETVMNTFPDWLLYEAMFRHPERLEASLANEHAEHVAMLEAIMIKDAGLAAQRAVEHLQDLEQQMVEFLNIPQDLLHEKVTLFGLTHFGNNFDNTKE